MRLSSLSLLSTQRIPKAEAVSRSETGRIKRLARGQGSGLIRASTADVFFHKSEVSGTFWTLQVGDRVTFDLLEDAVSGPRALRVRVVGSNRAGAR